MERSTAMTRRPHGLTGLALMMAGFLLLFSAGFVVSQTDSCDHSKLSEYDQAICNHAGDSIVQGRQTFRYDTFGDEVFWGDTLRLHEAIKGEALGRVGLGVSPN